MSNLGGKRPGAGRPKGIKSKTTLEKEESLKLLRQRVIGMTDSLVNAQASLAKGQQLLFRIDYYYIGKKKMAKEPKLVTNEQEIRDYIDALTHEDMDRVNDSELCYYFITTKIPDNKAIDSLLDRTFGKSTDTTKIIGEGDDGAIKLDVNIHNAIKKAYAKKRGA